MTKFLFGIDLGGTKIEGIVLRSDTLDTPLARIRIPTEGDKGYEHILSRIEHLVGKLETEVGVKADKIGIGTPGCLDPYTNTMKNCNTTALNGKPLKVDLEALLKRDVRIGNDANCFALAEAFFGAAKDDSVVFGIIMGTGVGGGIVINKKVLHGAQGIGGEWGHNVLKPGGDLCYCGKNGCVETCISGPALEKYFFNITQEKMTLIEILNRRNVESEKVIKHLCENFGRALATVINILDPDIVVLGGGVSNIQELYSLGVKELEKYVFNDALRTKIVKNKLGDSGGVFGAAILSE